ncbi:hypothetical protein BWK69_01085, partial [Candidatus Parcubacteria bacterium A4]
IDTWEFIKGTLWATWFVIKIMWPFLLFVFLIKIFEKLIPTWFNKWRNKERSNTGQKWRSDRDLLQQLRGMRPNEFEDYIADLFSILGYRTEVTGGSHDGGVDVVAEKDGVKHYIQCKKFYKWEVRVGDVRDFFGSIADRVANGKGYFITTNKFTLEAEKFAEDKPIELIDSFKLIKYIRMAEEKSLGAPQENKPMICPKCGGALAERSGKFGKFLGCSNYPKCQYTKNI